MYISIITYVGIFMWYIFIVPFVVAWVIIEEIAPELLKRMYNFIHGR